MSLARTTVRKYAKRARKRRRRQFWQFMICGAAFVSLVAAKVYGPEHAATLRRALSGAMDRNMDLQEVFSTVGRTFAGENDPARGLREVWQAVLLPPDGAETLSETVPEVPETLTPHEWSDSFGNSTAFASLSEPWPETSGAAVIPDPPSDGSAFDNTHPAGQASVLYTGQNLPENVGLEQVLLNFDYQCPVQGTLTSGFGYRKHPIDGAERFHYGVDIAAETGTPILCFADGVVTATGESTSFGKYCTVEHSGGFTTLYAHCSRITAASGAAVRMGDKLAEVGATGQATGPHLHFALQREGIYLNPVYYLAG